MRTRILKACACCRCNTYAPEYYTIDSLALALRRQTTLCTVSRRSYAYFLVGTVFRFHEEQRGRGPPGWREYALVSQVIADGGLRGNSDCQKPHHPTRRARLSRENYTTLSEMGCTFSSPEEHQGDPPPSVLLGPLLGSIPPDLFQQEALRRLGPTNLASLGTRRWGAGARRRWRRPRSCSGLDARRGQPPCTSGTASHRCA
jgi:hypothetical protein